MRILVTGYKGFIGQNMVKALSDKAELSLHEMGDPLPEIKGLDWVIHLGAISSTTETDVEKVLEHNLEFSKWLICSCEAYDVNLQYSSSASVYGLNTNFNEDAPCNPLSPYAWSKYLVDRYIKRSKWHITIQGFRYFNVYGPYEDHKGNQASPYHKFTKQAKETGTIKLFENSDKYLRDFVPVETVINTHLKFLNIKESGIWNVGTGKAKSFQTVAEEIAKEYNAKIEYIPMPDNLKLQYQVYTQADITKLNQTLSRWKNIS
jgi:ADP-L-glycero-D-manno-heptose 6-epimerase